jgi:hypothetical protein
MELALYHWMNLVGIKSRFGRYMDDTPMAEIPFTRNATVRKLETQGGGTGSPNVFQPGPEGAKVCAYNYTGQRFLSVAVEAGDFSPVILNRRLPTLTAGSGGALWIVPFRGISPTSVRFPVDLVFLNASGVVLQAVESFPISQPSSSGSRAASVLVLPEQTISATGTASGDQLLLCPPEEMKQRLQKMAQASTASAAAGEQASDEPTAPKAAGNVLPWVGRSRPVPPADATTVVENPVPGSVPVVEEPRAIEKPPILQNPPPVEVAPVEAPPPRVEASPVADAKEPDQDQPWEKRHKRPKGWFEKLLAPEPSDPRKSPREELPWLGAYFFTGGKPVAYPIRDISALGVYVFTEERWYPGTVIRVTLVDRRQPTADRSFTVNAKVVRPAKDGIGLEFVLNDDLRSRGKSRALDSQVGGVDRREVEDFLDRVRGGR